MKRNGTMMKKILFLAVVAFLLNPAGMVCRAQAEANGPETELAAVSIVIKGATVSVYNAEGSKLEIFSLTGAKVGIVNIDSNAKTINLSLKKGCYILKVNNVVRKVSIN